MEEDWDVLIVLDACRYDYFEELNQIPGNLEKRRSVASRTQQWFKKQFQGRYDDVVYVSANPYINSKVELEYIRAWEKFHRVIDVWDFGWDESLHNAHPRTVNIALLASMQSLPHKKFISHYLYPHAPYYIPRLDQFIVLYDSLQKHGERNLSLKDDYGWHGASGGEIIEAYKWNLQFVLGEIKDHLLPYLRRKKVVISSDHGELLGESGQWSHPAGNDAPELREVPWLEVMIDGN
jgi:hypothetical protein